MIDPRRFRDVMGAFPTGVTVITTVGPVGFTCQSFVALSLDPPLVAFCPKRSSASIKSIRAAGSFGVNILAAAQSALSRQFAASNIDRFEGVSWTPGVATRSPRITSCAAWIECEIASEHDGGDHTIVLGRVVDLGSDVESLPLLFAAGRYASLINLEA